MPYENNGRTSFSLQDFKTKLNFSGARPNHFGVRIYEGQFGNQPRGLDSGPGISSFEFFCKAASLPNMTLGVIEIPYFGRLYKVPGDRSYEEWSTTVINDEDFAIRDFLEGWSDQMNQIVDNVSDVYGNAANDYTTTVDVIQYGKNGDTIKVYEMVGAWISSIGPIDLSMETNDSIEEFEVTWQFQEWRPKASDRNPISIINENA